MTAELIRRLAATPRTVALLVAEANDLRLDDFRGDEWSARTILAHFRDAEVLEMRLALERMLAEECPTLAFIPAPAWAAGRNRRRDRKEWLLGDFALQRQASLAMLRGLAPEDWTRTGALGDRPPTTIESFVAFWARHDAAHIAQLEAALGETLGDVLARRAQPL